jgi:hypothetical protein
MAWRSRLSSPITAAARATSSSRGSVSRRPMRRVFSMGEGPKLYAIVDDERKDYMDAVSVSRTAAAAASRKPEVRTASAKVRGDVTGAASCQDRRTNATFTGHRPERIATSAR